MFSAVGKCVCAQAQAGGNAMTEWHLLQGRGLRSGLKLFFNRSMFPAIPQGYSCSSPGTALLLLRSNILLRLNLLQNLKAISTAS